MKKLVRQWKQFKYFYHVQVCYLQILDKTTSVQWNCHIWSNFKCNFHQWNWISSKNAALVIILAIRGLSCEKTLPRIWTRASTSQALDVAFIFYKVLYNKVPKYIYDLIPPKDTSLETLINSLHLLAGAIISGIPSFHVP